MSLKVINHFPEINATGIYRNEPIKIYFDSSIDQFSINWDTFSLNDSSTFSSVVGEIGPIWASGINLSGVTSGIMFIPTVTLLPNNEYSVYVYGTPNSILSKTGIGLSETYTYNFVTGTGYYDSTGNAGIPSGVASGIYDITLSGILDFQEDEIFEFKVYKTIPKNQTPNVSGSLIQIFFTGNILTSSGEISNYITLDEETTI